MSGTRVLIVDDDEDILWMNQMILSSEGFLVDTCNNPVDALEKYAINPYTVVILDYMMPDMHGDELGRRILDLCPDSNLVFLTGYAEAVREINKISTDFEVILKPVGADILIETVYRQLEKKTLHSTNYHNIPYARVLT